MNQPEPNGRSAYIHPKIKIEDEISVLGGMTRLVARRSTTSPSVTAPSPTSQHSSPSIPDSQHAYLPLSESSSTSSWQNYTHIQNLNVNINMDVGDFYPNNLGMVSPAGTAVTLDSGSLPTDEMEMMYQMHAPPSQHPHQHHPKQIQQSNFQDLLSHSQQQQINPQGIVTGMSATGLPMSPHEAYYMSGYGVGNSNAVGYGPIYGGQGSLLHSPSDVQNSVSPHNLHDSWQNLMSQYKPC